MTVDLTNPVFTDPDAARLHLESVRWPNGPVCPHCGTVDDIGELKGKSHRPGLYKCYGCRQQFTVTVGTVFERSKIPLNKWLLATYLLCGSKKGISSKQIERMLGVTYKTAWFMTHRIREAFRDGKAVEALGGPNNVVEADETYIGGKAKNRAFRKPRPKEAVFALVERDGRVRSRHVPNVTAKTLRKEIVTQASRKSYLMTDEAPVYRNIGREFSGHGTVNHSIDEYVRGGFWHTNTAENYFSILKRGINGVYQCVSAKHLKRYLGEFDFRYNTRKVDDWTRTSEALKGIEGKRVTYGGSAPRF